MTLYIKTGFFAAIGMVFLTFAAQGQTAPSEQFYAYLHNDAEYSVLLPDAPRVETIWADAAEPPPYLDTLPAGEVSLGEVAIFMRTDPETEDVFDVKVTFLKADRAFLTGLTQDKMRQSLENDLKDLRLENVNFEFLAGREGARKWATLTGFSIDKQGHPFYHAAHYLTGQQSILVVHVKYHVENAQFERYYKMLAENITYHAP